MNLTAKAQADFRAHVLEEYPNEACGLIVNGRYIKTQNVADNPRTHFQIDSKSMEKYDGKIKAILHSHPYALDEKREHNPVWPSQADMECWLADDIPWGIVATDGEEVSQMVWLDEANPEPLEGRDFIHGINDCFSLVRDYYRTKGITLINIPRGMEWWNKGQDLYSAHLEEAGFVEIPKAEATIGDACLFQVRSPVINHAAVITGDNEILHHMFHRLSGKDTLHKWDRVIVKYVRFKGKE